MGKRKRYALFLALALLLTCMTGCMIPSDAGPSSVLDAYAGTWYKATNGSVCHFGDGRIYRDERSSQEKDVLAGVYYDAGDHIQANLGGVGDVSVLRDLYIAQGSQGEYICENADGSGEVYFYRDPLVVLTLLEEQEQAEAATEKALDEMEEALRNGQADAPAEDADQPEVLYIETPEGDEAPDASPDTKALTPETAADDTQTQTSGSMVWIPQSGTKYHSTPSCSGMKNPSKVSLAEAKSRGYTPCKRCH